MSFTSAVRTCRHTTHTTHNTRNHHARPHLLQHCSLAVIGSNLVALTMFCDACDASNSHTRTQNTHTHTHTHTQIGHSLSKTISWTIATQNQERDSPPDLSSEQQYVLLVPGLPCRARYSCNIIENLLRQVRTWATRFSMFSCNSTSISADVESIPVTPLQTEHNQVT